MQNSKKKNSNEESSVISCPQNGTDGGSPDAHHLLSDGAQGQGRGDAGVSHFPDGLL